MPFDWDKHLTLALKLAENEEQEYQRCAVNRAYYAAFIKAARKLERQRVYAAQLAQREEGYSHRQVRDLYENRGNTAGLRVARRLKLLAAWRVTADYTDDDITPEQAAGACAEADELLKLLDRV